MWRSFASAALLLCLAQPAGARPMQGAEDTFQVRYDRSRALYQQGRYEECISELQAAYKLRQLPRLLVNIGHAYRKLGRAREALSHYQLYLQVEPDPRPEIRADVERGMAQARALLQATEPPAPPAPHASPPAPPAPGAQAVPALALRPEVQTAPAPQPVYKKWWFWTALGGAAVVAAGVTAGVTVSVLGRRDGAPTEPIDVK
jgi:tetratricopeptide (TPR) repeat protein